MNSHSTIRWCGVIFALLVVCSVFAQKPGERWSAEKAWKWYNQSPWICGFNYIPANAINYTAMWDKTGFSPDLIDRELTLAEQTGFNAARVVLQFIVWEDDPAYFKDAFRQFLSICARHTIRVIPALFDDCVFGTNVDPTIGIQPEPSEGWYAWAWSPSPGHTMVHDTTTYPRLERYVKDIIGTFKDELSVLLWDLYNEPTNSGMGEKSLPLVRHVFQWAREVNPSQPLSIDWWYANDALNSIVLGNSDIITFHNYGQKESLEKQIASLKEFKRPIICTEWLNRPLGSTVESVLPVFFSQNVGCLHWGLVNGKTQTHLPWGHRPGDGPYRGIWQHDLYTTDHKMYSPFELQLFRKYIAESKVRRTTSGD
jgi:hypothetical protein